jgi:hypothetical protein
MHQSCSFNICSRNSRSEEVPILEWILNLEPDCGRVTMPFDSRSQRFFDGYTIDQGDVREVGRSGEGT